MPTSSGGPDRSLFLWRSLGLVRLTRSTSTLRIRRNRNTVNRAVGVFLKRAGDTADPEFHAAPHVNGDIGPLNDDVGDCEAPAWLQNSECLGDHAVLLGGQIDHAIRDDHVDGAVRKRDVLDFAFEKL